MKRPLSLIGSIATTLALVPGMAFAQNLNTSFSSQGNAFFHGFLGSIISDNFNDTEDPIVDFAALRAHPCYEIVGGEMDDCLRMFGVTDGSSMMGTSLWTDLFVEQALDETRCSRFFAEARTLCLQQNDSIMAAILAELHQSDFFNASLDINGSTSVQSEEDEDLDNDDASSIRDRRDDRAAYAWDHCASKGPRMQPRCFRQASRLIHDDNLSETGFRNMLAN